MGGLIDLTGMKFGEWTVLGKGLIFKKKNGSEVRWLCKCSCGTEHNVVGSSLRGGHTVSCITCSYKNRRGIKSSKYKGTKDISGDFWYSITSGAAQRGIPFNITIHDAQNLLEKQNYKCAISGISLISNISPKDDLPKKTISLDRINSDVGYELSNVQWVHLNVNIMKNSLNQDVFLNYCKEICSYQNSKNVNSPHNNALQV